MPDVFFSVALDRALGWMVVHSIWQATLIALISGVLMALLSDQTARLRYRIAGGAMLAVLLAAAGTFLFYYHSFPLQQEAVYVEKPVEKSNLPGAFQGQIRTATPIVPISTAPATPVIGRFRAYFDEHLPLIVTLWILGMAAFLLRLLGGLSYVYYLRVRLNFPVDPYWSELLEGLVQKSGLKKTIPVLESALTRSPLTIGYLKPLILFPIGVINHLSEREVEAILAHELAHILRRDYLFNILQSIVEALFYYHPAVWWLSAQLRSERESACDEQAIEWCGSKLNYAKALVTMQEMAFYPTTPALAFSGQRQSQFLRRMQRLFKQPQSQFNIMEKWIATSLVVCSILALTFGQQIQRHQSDANAETSPENAFRAGIWEADIVKDSICITYSARSGRNGNWVHSDCYLQTAFTGMPLKLGEVQFDLTRPAGAMHFTGKMESEDAAYGRFTFTPSEEYRKNLQQEGIANVDDELIANCFFSNLPVNYLKTLRSYGYTNISRDELQELAIFHLDETAIKNYKSLLAELGDANPSLRELIECSIHGIDRPFLQSLRDAGYTKLSAEKVRDFKIHGIDAPYIREMTQKNGNKLPEPDDLLESKIHGLEKIDVAKLAQAGYKDLSHEELLTFAIHDIDENYIREVSALGLGKLSADDLVSAKVHGITPEFVKSFQDMKIAEVNMDNLMQVKVHDISPEFIKSFKDLKIAEVTLDNLMQAKVHDINPEFIKSFRDMKIAEVTLDNLMQAKVHDITPEFVKSFKDMKLAEVTLDNLMQVKVHDITPEFIKTYQSMKIGKPDLDNLMQAKVHDITPEFKAGFQTLGFENLDLDDLMQAKVHGVTPDFIKEARKKGYNLNSLGEYAELKIHSDWMEKKRAQ